MPCFCFRLRSEASSKSCSISWRLSSLKFNKSRLGINFLLLREDFFENTEAARYLFLGNRQRRDKAQDLVGSTIEEQPFFHTRIDDLSAFHFEFESKQQPPAANAADEGKTTLEL